MEILRMKQYTMLHYQGKDAKRFDIISIYDFSFLAGGFHQNKTQRQIRSSGIFDSEILTHVPGDKTIYQAMRDWVRANSPIHQEVEGRFTITSIDENEDNGKSNSGPFVPSFLTFLLGLSIFLL